MRKATEMEYNFMKLFKLETILKDDRPSEWWIEIGVALTMSFRHSLLSLVAPRMSGERGRGQSLIEW